MQLLRLLSIALCGLFLSGCMSRLTTKRSELPEAGYEYAKVRQGYEADYQLARTGHPDYVWVKMRGQYLPQHQADSALIATTRVSGTDFAIFKLRAVIEPVRIQSIDHSRCAFRIPEVAKCEKKRLAHSVFCDYHLHILEANAAVQYLNEQPRIRRLPDTHEDIESNANHPTDRDLFAEEPTLVEHVKGYYRDDGIYVRPHVRYRDSKERITRLHDRN